MLLFFFKLLSETNAIEEFFSHLKHHVKKKSPKIYDEIKLVIKKQLKPK